MEDDDDQSTCIEPVISYSSSLTNRGVKEMSHSIYNSLKKPNKIMSSNNTRTRSLYNTIMLPFIISDGSPITDSIDNNLNNSFQTSKNNNISSNNYYTKYEIERIQTTSSKNHEDNDDFMQVKTTNTHKETSFNNIKNSELFSKRISMHLPKSSYDEILIKNNNEKPCYESDSNHKYNKKFDLDIKNSAKVENTRHLKLPNEKMPSLFLSAVKAEKEKEKEKNLFIYKPKKKKKTVHKSQKFQIKSNDVPAGLRRKDRGKTSVFRIEKSKSFSDESLNNKIKNSYKKEKKNSISGDNKNNKKVYRSNKNLKDIMKNEDLIKKVYTTNITKNIEKNKSIIKTDKKKKKKNDRKTSFKENNVNNKLVKVMFSKNLENKKNKYESSGLKMLRDYINNRNYIEKKDEEKNKKEISRKIKRKNTNIRNKNEKTSDKYFNERFEDRRSSGFLVKEEVMKNIFEKPSNKDKKNFKNGKNNENENNDSKNDINKLKLSNGGDNSNKNILINVSRRKRSISMHYNQSTMKVLKEELKSKLPKKSTLLNTTSTTAVTKKKKPRKKSDVEVFLKNDLKETQYSLFNKFTNTVFIGPDFSKYIIGCFEIINDMDVESQIRLKSKINFNFPKQKKKGLKKRIALFDLDETLVHCTGDVKTSTEKYQHLIDINLPGKQSVRVGINLRPLWKETLDLVKKKYHIVIHTASHQAYADAVLDFMDPQKKYFKYRLYRNNCSLVDSDGAKFYVKDLDIFDEYYDLKDIVIIDNSVLSFAYHLYNGIPIVPYYEGDKDSFLYIVGLYLDHIYKAKDLREANKKLINLDYFSQLAKNKMENENGDIIDEESDTIEEVDENMGNDGQSKENTKGGDETKKSGKSKHKSKKSNCEPGEIKPSSTPKSVRKTIQDLSDKNLMCASNLFNLYLELKEQSNSNINKGSVTAKISKKESLLDKISFTNYTKIANNEKDEADNNDDYKFLDCRSLPDIRHPYAINNQYIEKIEENNDLTSKSMKKVKKVMTLCNGEAFSNSIKNEIMGDLEIIKSNFSHKFQGLDNKTDN